MEKYNGASLKVHKITKLKDDNELIHMTFTDENKVNHNIWLVKKDEEVIEIDISWPYEGE